jgi:hypothetical protein
MSVTGIGAQIAASFGKASETVTTFAGTTGSSYLIPAIVAIIAIVLVVVIVLVIVQTRSVRPSKETLGPLDLYAPTSPIVVDRATTKAAMGGSYTLSFYLKVDAVPDMRSSATPLLTWPGIWNLSYNAAQEQLLWIFNQTQQANVLAGPETVTVSKVPLQRWNQITLAFEGRSMDFYVNGALIKSASLTNVPPSANSSITIVPNGIMGQLAYIQVWPRRLSVSEVGANYVDTCDSQGRPYLGPDFLKVLSNIKTPNLFCPSGSCDGSQPTASSSQKWEFPYA